MVVFLNFSSSGSIGNIIRNLSFLLKKDREDCLNAYAGNAKTNPDDYIICNEKGRTLHKGLSYLTGLEGCFSFFSTLRFLNKLQQVKPDIIHIHNLHGWYINLFLLFHFLKKHPEIHPVWTLHDCWAFTGHCPHYEKEKCEKWISGCHNCCKHLQYPKSYPDNSRLMYSIKKKLFTGLDELTIVTPSEWLCRQMKQSFLKQYPVRVINNGIDLSIFKPTKSDFRKRYGLENKFIILGVGSIWNYSKGLDVFVELSSKLPDKYQIILVGTNEKIESQLQDNVISIRKTNNQTELAEIYSSADVFLNPTREDTFPTVNIEALACGTPVITFFTGGSPEILTETCGKVITNKDVPSIIEAIKDLEHSRISPQECVTRAKEFDMNVKLIEYLNLYSDLRRRT